MLKRKPKVLTPAEMEEIRTKDGEEYFFVIFYAQKSKGENDIEE